MSRGALTRWMFDEYRLADESLAVSRVLTALCLLALVYPRYVWLTTFPSSFYAPPLGLGIFSSGLPPSWMLWALLAAAVTLTLALLVGWHTRLVGLALAAVLLVGNTFEYALGKINHDILLLVVLVTMSFSGWGRRFSVDERRSVGMAPAAAWPVALLALVVGFAMFSAGLPKAMAGWLDPRTQSAEYHLLVNYYVFERPTVVGRLALDHVPTAGWEALDWATVGLELSFLPAAFSRRATLAVCGLAVLFHAVIHATMEISFSTNLLAYAMFVDWAAGPSRSRLDGVWSGLAVLSRARGWQILAAGIVASLLYGAVADPMLARLRPIVDIDRVRFSLAMLAAVGVVVFAAGRAIVERRARDGTEAPTGLDRHPLVLFDGVCGMCNRTRRFRARARPGRPVSLRRPAVGGRAGGAGAASAAARLQRLHGADRGRAMPSPLDRRARDRAAARSALVDPVGARGGPAAAAGRGVRLRGGPPVSLVRQARHLPAAHRGGARALPGLTWTTR